MEPSIKTNRLALVSFISGLIALLGMGLVFALYRSPEVTGGVITITDGIIIPARNLCVVVALVTGIFALRDLKKKGGSEKGKVFAWVGIILGAGWILFGLLVGVAFFLGEILH